MVIKCTPLSNNLADALNLQENLNRLSSWCIGNKLALSVSKCKVISYSYKKLPLSFNYHIRGDQEGLFKLVTLNSILNRITGVTFGC
jgi:hypothetical protein